MTLVELAQKLRPIIEKAAMQLEDAFGLIRNLMLHTILS